jgi:broad specificity phosphatase PhoE
MRRDHHRRPGGSGLEGDGMSTLREAAQQALEALEFVADEWGFTQKANRPERWQAIEALRAALAQQEQAEPVAYTSDVSRRMREAGMTFHLGMPHAAVMEQMTRFHDLVCAEASIKAAVAFATPPRREWQSLRNKEIVQIVTDNLTGGDWVDVARAIEAALRSKNHE